MIGNFLFQNWPMRASAPIHTKDWVWRDLSFEILSRMNFEWAFLLPVTEKVPYRYICWVSMTDRGPGCISELHQFLTFEPLQNHSYRRIPSLTKAMLKWRHIMQVLLVALKAGRISFLVFMKNTSRLEYKGLCVWNRV